MYKYGDVVVLVANPLNRKTAPFKRLRSGGGNIYVIDWVRDNQLHVHWKRDGHIVYNSRNILYANEVVPEKFLNKSLEDYL